MRSFFRHKISLIIKIIKMPIRVILFRIYQTIRLKVISRFDLWDTFQKSTQNFDEILKKNNDVTKVLSPSILISVEVKEKLLNHFDKNKILKQSIQSAGDDVLSGKYMILGSPLPPLNKIDWHSDWRFDKKWATKYFNLYSFYGERENPYDVKYPWELSRLQFVIPLMENAVLCPEDKGWLKKSRDIIADWKVQNPLANSVAWYPMEASMRLTCLVQILDLSLLVAQHNDHANELAVMLCKMIAEHGHFVWETREYTAQCGNHYAANIVGLCVAGLALRDIYPEGRKWLDFSKKQIQKQIITQFYDDGVNFEKSTGYHRLVTELFLISLIGLEKAGFPINEQIKKRIHNACIFASDMVRPDGMSVNFGDNDNAIAFNFIGRDPRCYNDFLNIAAAYFNDETLSLDDGNDDFSSIWFDFGLNKEIAQPTDNVKSQVRYYEGGGYVVAAAL